MPVSRAVQSLAATLAALTFAFPGPAATQTSVGRFQELPAPDARVPLLSPAALQRFIAEFRPLVLLDTREEIEFAVSHISGAVRIQSAVDRDALLGHVRAHAQGATIVFYCTGGARSHQLAEALHYDLIAAGAAGVHVLAGGIIGWANEGLDLVDARGLTRAVHPWNAEMARGLRDPDRMRYAPHL